MAHDFTGSVADIVNADYRTEEVFRKYNINYCCGAKVSIEESCTSRNIDYNEMINELEWVTRNIVISNNLPFDQWEVDFLIDYIFNIHHTYIYQTIPVLGPEFNSFVMGHQKKFPELSSVMEILKRLYSILLINSKHEELIIFPYIKQIGAAFKRKEVYGNLFVRTLRKPLNQIQSELEEIGKLIAELKVLTNDFKPPEKSCSKHKMLYRKLNEFYDNLVQHNYLELNLLFPKAIDIENQLLQT
jgi:regulator of cell morphogenesis and NO signaling